MNARRSVLWLAPAALVVVSNCASKRAPDPAPSSETPAVHAWSNVEKLSPGTAVRVTERDGDRAVSYTHLTLPTILRV